MMLLNKQATPLKQNGYRKAGLSSSNGGGFELLQKNASTRERFPHPYKEYFVSLFN